VKGSSLVMMAKFLGRWSSGRARIYFAKGSAWSPEGAGWQKKIFVSPRSNTCGAPPAGSGKA
jgi:hypothetical protein